MRKQLASALTTTSDSSDLSLHNASRSLSLRYGTNPHQSQEAELYSLQTDMPIKGIIKKIFFLLLEIKSKIKSKLKEKERRSNILKKKKKNY